MGERRKTSRIVTWLSAILIMELVLAFPVGFLFMSYRHVSTHLESEAEANANQITQLISDNPRLWRYESNRLDQYLSARSRDEQREARRIFDADGKLVAQRVDPLLTPVVTRRFELMDAGVVVGHLEVQRSLRPELYETGIIALFASLIGGAIFLLLWQFPLRALKRTEEELARSEASYRSLIETANDAIFIIGARSANIEMVNRRAEQLLGMSRGTIVGRPLFDFYPTDKHARYARLFRRQTQRNMTLSKDMYLCRRDGEAVPVEVSSSVTEYQGRCVVQASVRDIRRRKAMEEALRNLASTDPLTGVLNRRTLRHALEREIARARRYGTDTALIMYDLDHFKQINDTHGHDAGDMVLREVTALVANQLRQSDLLARWGGEEFLILAPQTSLAEALALAEKQRLAIAGHLFAKVDRITASFGVAVLGARDDSERLIKRADDAMYEAKSAGRDRVLSA